MSRGSKRRRKAIQAAEAKQTDAPAKVPPSELEGDALLGWLCEHDQAPSDVELAAVELIGADTIADVPFHHYGLYDESIFTGSVDDVRTYFEREAPDAIFSDDAARLTGLLRTHAEAHNLPSSRWAQWERYINERN